MIIFAHNQNMLALHFLQIDTADNDNKGLNWFDHAFHGKHALAGVYCESGKKTCKSFFF
jgi:hypothetical protein